MFAANRLSSVIFAALASVPLLANALGSSCAAPLGPGNAAASAPYWLQDMPLRYVISNHFAKLSERPDFTSRGTSAFNANPSTYPVRRNVKDYGAKGDGTTDDTAAINAAIADGSRCGEGTCDSSTLTPALVFFPSG
jgi:glucan 1,3-beta-glucosidase